MIEFYVPTWYRVSSVPIIVPGTQNRSNVPGTHPVHIIVPGTQYTSLYVVSGIISTHNCTQYTSIIIPPGIGYHQHPSLYQVPSTDHCTWYRGLQSCARVGQGCPSPHCHQCKKSSGSLAEKLMSHNIHRNEKYLHKDQCHQCKKASGSFAEKIYI